MESQRILNHKTIGFGSAFVFLHGLLGSGDNWNTFAKRFGEDHQLVFPDLRNHGLSFHEDKMDYPAMAEDLVRLMDHLEIENAVVLGHSMGGKTAIQLANAFPGRVKCLIVVDSTFDAFPGGHEYILDVIHETDLSQFHTRKEIQEALAANFEDAGMLYFIMKNIQRHEGGFRWRIHIDGIRDNYPNILKPLDIQQKISVPTLFCMAQDSKYLDRDHHSTLEATFSNARIYEISDSGHWIHVDNPDELYARVSAFVDTYS